MRHYSDRAAWEHLAENGPSTNSDDGFSAKAITPDLREAGICSFTIVGRRGSSVSGFNHPQTVYYIEGQHDEIDVLRRWLEVNRDAIDDDVSDWALHHRIADHGPAFLEASRQLLDPSHHDGRGHGDGTTDVERCAVCDTPITGANTLAEHLPDCPGGPTGGGAFAEGSKTPDCPLCEMDLDGTALSYHLPDCPNRTQSPGGEQA